MNIELAPVVAPAFAGRNIANVKAHNLQAVLLTLLYQGPVSRAGMAELTGLSTTTITNLMAELLEQGIVVEEGREPQMRPGAGRPRISVRLVPGARYAAGIHLDVDNIRVAVTDLSGSLGHCYTAPHSHSTPPEAVLEQAAALVEQAVADAEIDRGRLLGVGVGASGLVNLETGVNMLAPNLGWRNLPVRDILAERLGLHVIVENNVRAMALGESMFGAGRNVHSLAFVYARIGVGAGLIVDGRVYRGSHAGAGEIGHTTIIPEGGAACRCGNYGCLETLVSEPAIMARMRSLAETDSGLAWARSLGSSSAPSAGAAIAAGMPGDGAVGAAAGGAAGAAAMEQIFAAARNGSGPVRAMLEECGLYMGTALANLINIINPDVIILGGLLAAGQDVLLPEIEATMRRRAFGGLGQQVELRTATFGAHAGVLGAAALALDALVLQAG